MDETSGKPVRDRELKILLSSLREMQLKLRNFLVDHLHGKPAEDLSAVAEESPADTIYRIDADCDSLICEHLEELGRHVPVLLVAEGISEEERLVFPRGNPPEDCLYRVIVDPIDGTRMLMYDKRSAWTLAAVAPNHGEETRLDHVELALMTELPPSKQTLSDVIWAVKGSGVRGWRENLLDGSRRAWRPTPSRAVDLHHGFAQVSKFFMGRKAVLAELEERIFAKMGAFDEEGRTRLFDDQYLSTGGQVYELLAGHDRFQADLRGAMRRMERTETAPPGIAAHPYDICTELIAGEAGVVITDLHDEPLRYPLDTTTDVDWIGYANADLHQKMRPVVRECLEEMGFL